MVGCELVLCLLLRRPPRSTQFPFGCAAVLKSRVQRDTLWWGTVLYGMLG